MKKMGFLLVAALVISGALFAGGKSQGGAAAADGLTTLRVFGLEQSRTFNGREWHLSDWINGKMPSRLWDELNAELARRGLKLEYDLINTDHALASQTAVASGTFNNYDYFYLSETAFNETSRQNLASQGRLYALNQLVSQYSTGEAKAFYDSEMGRYLAGIATLEDGNWYWIKGGYKSYVWKRPDNPHGNFIIPFIRQDWLDRLKLPMPSTLAQFTDTLIAFRTRDANGNGRQDEVAAIGLDNFANGVAQWFGLGTDLVSLFQDGSVKSPWYQPNIKAYLTYMNQLYKAGVLRIGDTDGNLIGFTRSWATETWVEPGLQAAPGGAKPYLIPLMIQAVPGTPPLAWQESLRGFAYDNLYVVPKATKNAAGVAKLLDFLLSSYWRTWGNWGIEGYTFNMTDGIPVISQPNSQNVGIDQEIVLEIGPPRNLPRIRLNEDKLSEAMQVFSAFSVANGYPDGGQTKFQWISDGYEDKFGFVLELGANMAPASPKELDRINAISPDLNTYSAELLTALISGQKSLDGWDGYMADLKRLGLDELTTISQARLSRVKR